MTDQVTALGATDFNDMLDKDAVGRAIAGVMDKGDV